MRRWAWLWIPIALLVTCLGWALTSPVGSSPDDDYHLSSIWCAQGIRPGICEGVPGSTEARAVPVAVVQAADCYRYDPAVNASCTRSLASPQALVATDRVNATAGLYPGGFYSVMSVFVGPDVERSVLLMRVFNALVAALLLAGLLRLTPLGISSAGVLAIAVTFIPLGLSLIASTNPSSWAIVGIGTYWAFAYALLRRRIWLDRRGVLVTIAVAVSGAMTIAARVDASAYLILATVVVLTLAGWRRSLARPGRIGILAILCVAAAVAYLARGSVVAGGTGMGSTSPGGGLLLTNLAYLPTLFQGIVGGWQLGWNDTVMPPFVPVTGTLILGALAYRGLQSANARKLAAAGVAAAGLVAVPIVFLQANGLGVGEVVQPRYLLPLLTLLMGVLALGDRPNVPLPLPRVPAWVLGGLLSISAALAFWANAHRYAAGNTVGLFDPKMSPAWLAWPGLPLWLTVGVTIAASTAFVSGSLLASTRPIRLPHSRDGRAA